MRLFDLKTKEISNQEQRTARGFWKALCGCDMRKAASFACDSMEWFGVVVGADDWESPEFSSFVRAEPLDFSKVREVPVPLLEALGPDRNALLGGQTETTDPVLLVDIQRGESEFTIGMTLHAVGSGFRVARIFDPNALAQFVLETLSAEL